MNKKRAVMNGALNGIYMKCMHCLVNFHHKEVQEAIGKDADGGWIVLRYDCPACNKMNLFLANVDYGYQNHQLVIGTLHSVNAIRPKGSSRPPCPPEVPQDIAEDYTEACVTLSDSPKASAALSRRCLQAILRTAGGVKHGNLDNEIQQVVNAGQLPTHLVQVIDAVRNIGNFSAHPMKSQATGEIVPVEPQEAEWNLEVLESLFDFYYVQPALAAQKRAALNAKLQQAGKPPMK